MKDTPPPRFVPVLTEVVETSVAPAPTAFDPALPAGSEPGPGLPLTEDELARRVVAQVLGEVEPMVLEALRSLQAQQARSLEVMVRTELAARVALRVGEALARPPAAPQVD